MAMKANFTVGGASSAKVNSITSKQGLLGVSQKYNMTCVPYEKIEINQLNKGFSQEDAELLMYSIIRNGLLHPLTVTYDNEKGTYKLISGEQRYHAIGMMDGETKAKCFPNGIPVNITLASKNEVEEKIRIIEANIIGRNYTPENRSKYIRELIELYQNLQAQGEIDNAVKKIIELTNLTERQVRNYVAINNNMIPELKEALDEKKITMKESSKFATFSEEAQHEIYNIIMSSGKIKEEEFAAIKDIEKKNKELQQTLTQNEKELRDKEQLINALNKKIQQAEEKANENVLVKNEASAADDVALLKDLLAKEEAKAKRLKTENDKYRMQEKAQRSITLDSETLKKAATIAKAENLYQNMFSMFKEAEKIRDTILKDEELKSSYQILAGLFGSTFAGQ